MPANSPEALAPWHAFFKTLPDDERPVVVFGLEIERAIGLTPEERSAAHVRIGRTAKSYGYENLSRPGVKHKVWNIGGSHTRCYKLAGATQEESLGVALSIAAKMAEETTL